MSCPDGHRWWKCSHPELARPTLGAILMCVGVFNVFVGCYYLLG